MAILESFPINNGLARAMGPRAFSGEVASGSSWKIRENKNLERLTDPVETESALDAQRPAGIVGLSEHMIMLQPHNCLQVTA
jgi:hypothetical protein